MARPARAGETAVGFVLRDMDADDTPESTLAAILDPDETARARRFAFPGLGRRFRVGRATLRRVLGRRLGCAPAAVTFDYGPQGKPFVAGAPAFNLAHADNWLLIVLAPAGVRIGVDLEVIRPVADLEPVSESYFAPAERRALMALPAPERDPAFLRIWTRKEAFIKALGGGLSIPLDSFTVSAAPGTDNVLRSVSDPGERPNAWFVGSLALPGRLEAAVALDAPSCSFRALDDGSG